jgi:hypothetical protein
MMRRLKKSGVFLVLAIVVSGRFASAVELMSGASAMEAKSWSVAVYGTAHKSEPRVKNGSTDLDFDEEHEASNVALTLHPGEHMQYRFLYGVLRNYELEIGSSTFVNTHESQSDGHQFGFGTRWNASPVTPVSLGVAVDLSYVRRTVDFEKLTSNGTTSALNERFEQDEFQAAVNVGKRWAKLEPYGGLKTNYVKTRILDRATQSDLHGSKIGFSPFVGLKWEFFEKESLMLEASFADEEALSAGLNIQF